MASVKLQCIKCTQNWQAPVYASNFTDKYFANVLCDICKKPEIKEPVYIGAIVQAKYANEYGRIGLFYKIRNGNEYRWHSSYYGDCTWSNLFEPEIIFLGVPGLQA